MNSKDTTTLDRVERMASKFKVNQETSCWEMLKVDVHGYGQISFNGRSMRAHRAVYTLIKGEIPNNLPLDHLCLNKACVNPNHLEPVTTKENVQRGIKSGLYRWKDGYCIKGHEFTPENTITYPDKRRTCKICTVVRRKERNRLRTQARRLLRQSIEGKQTITVKRTVKLNKTTPPLEKEKHNFEIFEG